MYSRHDIHQKKIPHIAATITYNLTLGCLNTGQFFLLISVLGGIILLLSWGKNFSLFWLSSSLAFSIPCGINTYIDYRRGYLLRIWTYIAIFILVLSGGIGWKKNIFTPLQLTLALLILSSLQIIFTFLSNCGGLGKGDVPLLAATSTFSFLYAPAAAFYTVFYTFAVAAGLAISKIYYQPYRASLPKASENSFALGPAIFTGWFFALALV